MWIGFDLFLVPLSEQNLDTLAKSCETLDRDARYLTLKMAAEIGRMLGSGRALYVETGYFGGTGAQNAVLFENGAIVWQKFESSEEVNKRRLLSSYTVELAAGLTKSLISQGLNSLGVTPEEGKDEFDTVGLGQYLNHPLIPARQASRRTHSPARRLGRRLP